MGVKALVKEGTFLVPCANFNGDTCAACAKGADRLRSALQTVLPSERHILFFIPRLEY